jgi:hypothetical protein
LTPPRSGRFRTGDLMDGKKRQLFLLSGLTLVIVASLTWIYFTEFRTTGINEPLHTGVGQVLADQTVRILGSNGHIVLVLIDASKYPELKVQLEAFEKKLKKFKGVTVKDRFVLDTDEKPHYGAGAGLSARRFLRVVNKSAGADAIVSFIGAPHLADDDYAQLGTMPKFVAECRSAEKLTTLFEKKVLQVAVVARFQFPAPGKHSPHSPKQWFEKRYQVVTEENAASLP